MAIYEKDQARPMPIPPGRESVDKMSTPSPMVEPEVQDNVEPANTQELQQADFLLGGIKDRIWDEDYDQVVASLKKGGDLEKSVGSLAGELVNNEVKMAQAEGVNVSREILIAVGAEVVNELAELAVHEGLIELKDDSYAQEFQAGAMVHAVNRYSELGDEGINPVDSIELAQTIMRGQVPESEIMNRMGVAVPPQPPEDEILMEETVSV